MSRRMINSRIVHGILISLVAPFILLTFMVLFGSESYQYWGDKYHSVLTSQYIFSRLDGTSLLGPLWREDIFSGNLWHVTLGATVPFMVDTVAARVFYLSPVEIDMVSNLIGYVVAAGGMFLYLRRVMGIASESAMAVAMLFAASGYVLSVWTGCANDFSTTGLLPILLALSHRLKAATDKSSDRTVLLAWIVLALATYAGALASSVKTLPILLTLVTAYAVFVFRSARAAGFVILALLAGVALYAPWLWLSWDAARISQRLHPSFIPQASFDLQDLLGQALVVLKRVVSGFNVYGLTMPVVLVLALACVRLRETLRDVDPAAKRILQFSVPAFMVCFAMDAFAAQINDVKRHLPIVSGFDVVRFEWFVSFFTLVPVTWMLDHGAGERDAPGSGRRWVIVGVAVLFALQAAHIASRTVEAPASIYPQNLVLFAYLTFYIVLSLLILVMTYGGLGGSARSWRTWGLALMALSVLFQASVIGYRHGIEIRHRTSDDEPIMTYAQRFSIPADLAELKAVNRSGDRVVDLTRPFSGVLTTPGNTVLQLTGLRTPVGYGNLFPQWYDQFITRGVNGEVGTASRWAEIKERPETSFAALQLLDVKYVLASADASLPGYAPWRRHEPTGKVIYAARPEVGPAFLSPRWHCLASDEAALAAVHEADYGSLVRRAMLVSTDVAAHDLCKTVAPSERQSEPGPARIEVSRGHDLVTIDVASETGGILTLADVYYPGWHASVDGVETPVLRTYTTLRGVVVGAGTHRIEFTFYPGTFYALLWMSWGLLAGMVGTAGWLHWANTRSSSYAAAGCVLPGHEHSISER